MAGTAACSSSRAAVRSSKAGMNMRHCYALKGEGKVKRNSGLRTSRFSGLFFAILATGLSLGYALASEEELRSHIRLRGGHGGDDGASSLRLPDSGARG